MKRRCVVLAAVWLLVLPSRARAGDWWDVWGFLDQLSGPGPFKSNASTLNPEFRLPAIVFESTEADRFYRADTTRDPRMDIVRNTAPAGVLYPAFRLTKLRTDEGMPRFLDSTAVNNTRPVSVFAFEPSLMYRAGTAVDLGVGLSFTRFSGDGFDAFWHTGLIAPKVTISPLALFGDTTPGNRGNDWKHVVNVSLDGIFFPGFDPAKDFNDTTTKYVRHHEYLVRAGIQIDVELIGAKTAEMLRK